MTQAPPPDWVVSVMGYGDDISVCGTGPMTLDVAVKVIVSVSKLLLDSNLAGAEGSERIREMLLDIVQIGEDGQSRRGLPN